MTSSAPARTADATTVVTTTVLNPGFTHLIASRPSNVDIIGKNVQYKANGGRYAPQVTFRSGIKRQVILATVDVKLDRIEFTGTMPNGSELVRVKGQFFGDNRGSLQVLPAS